MHGIAESALQNTGIKLVQCICSPDVHCRTRKSSLCNASARRKCIAEFGNQACAMHLLAGCALQNPEIKLVQCICSPDVHCRIRESSLCNAWYHRKCIAEYGKQACAMHGIAESALQNTGIKLVQCICPTEVHCMTRKSSLCNASARRECIAGPGNQACVMHLPDKLALLPYEVHDTF